MFGTIDSRGPAAARPSLWSLAALALAWAPSAPAAAPSPAGEGDLLRTFENPNPSPASELGEAVAAADGLVVLGQSEGLPGGLAQDYGTVRVVRATTGELLHQLEGPSPNDGFGRSVALHGGVLAVGSPNAARPDGGTGRVDLFDAVTGQHLQALVPAPAAGVTLWQFGASVDLDQGLCAVGAPFDDTGGGNTGTAYLFDVATGALVGQVFPSNSTTARRFGTSVALADGTLAVGAPETLPAGSVHLFDTGTSFELWRVLGQQDLGLFEPARLGQSVDVDAGHVLAGAPQRNVSFGAVNPFGDGPGGAYLFDAASGAPLLFLDPVPVGGEGTFGDRVALERERALVGAPWHYSTTLGTTSGFVGLFEVPSGTLLAELFVDDGAPFSSVGSALALDHNRAVLGSPWFDNGTSRGAAFLFEAAPEVGVATCAGVPNSTGGPASLAASGFGAVDRPLSLRATDLPPNEFGLFLVSDSTGTLPMVGGGQGTLCLGATFGRFLDSLANSGDAGVLEHDVDPTALPLTPVVAVQPGETWHFQAWYRDANPVQTSNLSGAVAVTFP